MFKNYAAVQRATIPAYAPRYPVHDQLWKQVYNIVDGKIFKLSYIAYLEYNLKPDGSFHKKHVPYVLPEEVKTMVNMLDELPQASQERCHEIYNFAMSGSVTRMIDTHDTQRI